MLKSIVLTSSIRCHRSSALWSVDIHILARQYDEAIAVCKKLANENPTFAEAHSCLAERVLGETHVPAGH